MEDKNKTFCTRGNICLDKLFCITETNLLPENIKEKIKRIALSILTNYIGEEEIKTDIDELIGYMGYLTIYSETFIKELKFLFEQGLIFEKNRK